MDILLGVDVLCGGESCGRSSAVIVNPVTEEMTHIVVKEAHAPHTERIVPASAIEISDGTELLLKASRDDLSKMEPFVETYFIQTQVERYGPGSAYAWPYVVHTREARYIPEREEKVPLGEVAVHRGAKVLATDGPVGKVDEFVVAEDHTHITHLVMREGHLWGSRDVAIPISEVESMSEETVKLKIPGHQVESLPKISVHRHH